MSKDASRWFQMFQPTGREGTWILDNFFIENLFKSKPKIIGEFGFALSLVGKPSLSRI
jgi:hypothetical protein